MIINLRMGAIVPVQYDCSKLDHHDVVIFKSISSQKLRERV